MDRVVVIQCIVNGLLLGFVFSLIAAGLSLIFGVMGFVNFAHGDMLMVGLYTSFYLWYLFRLDPLVSMPVTVFVVIILGVAMYKVIISRVLNAPRMMQMLASFGMMVLLRSTAQFFLGTQYRLVRDPIIEGSITVGGVALGFPQLFAGVAAIASSAALYWILERTELGRALKATAENRNAAYLMGIDINKMNTLAWVLGAASVGLAAALLSSYYFVFPDVGAVFGMTAVVTVALGGFGSVPGAFVAGIAIGLVMGIGGFFISTEYKYAMIFVVFLLVVVVRPQGLMGTSRQL